MREKIDYIPTFLSNKATALMLTVLATEIIVKLDEYFGLFAASPWNVLVDIVWLGYFAGWCLVDAAIMKAFKKNEQVASLAKANFILWMVAGFFVCIADWLERDFRYAYVLLAVSVLFLGLLLAYMLVSILLGVRLQKHFDGNAKEVGKWMVVYNLVTVVTSLVVGLVDTGNQFFWVVFLATIYVVWKYCNALGNLLGKPDEETKGITEQ